MKKAGAFDIIQVDMIIKRSELSKTPIEMTTSTLPSRLHITSISLHVSGRTKPIQFGHGTVHVNTIFRHVNEVNFLCT